MSTERSITKHAVRLKMLRLTKDLMRTKRFSRYGIVAGFHRFVKPYELPPQERELIEQYFFEVLVETEKRLKVLREILEDDIFHRRGHGG